MNKRKYLWEFSFDLSIHKLENFYGKPTYTNAYKEVGRYLINHGFNQKDIKQGSCYFTSKELSQKQANKIITDMYKVLPWLPFCVKPLKTALTIRQEIELDHSIVIKKLIKDKKHIEKLNKYYENIGAFDKIIETSKTSSIEVLIEEAKEKSKESKIKAVTERKVFESCENDKEL